MIEEILLYLCLDLLAIDARIEPGAIIRDKVIYW